MEAKIKINLGENQAAKNVDYWGELVTANIHELNHVLPQLEKKALNVGGYVVKKSIKDTMMDKWPASSRPFTVKHAKNPKAKTPYITKSDPISEGVRQTRAEGGRVIIFVGNGGANTAGYLAKMYDHDSKIRYQKTLLGKKLSKPKKLGKLTGVNYFNPAVNISEDQAYDAMERILFSKIKQTIEE